MVRTPLRLQGNRGSVPYNRDSAHTHTHEDYQKEERNGSTSPTETVCVCSVWCIVPMQYDTSKTTCCNEMQGNAVLQDSLTDDDDDDDDD